jgi:uncharacterized protein YndB with AHSA1/START domain
MSRDGTLIDPHTVEFKRLLPGPIELAWDYLTKPEMMRTWFADVTLEPRAGGAINVNFGKDACGTGGIRGTIREFRPPRVISFSWVQLRPQADGAMAASDEGEVRFELAEKGEKVLLTLLHSGLPLRELIPHSAGWHAYLDNLDSVISGRGAINFIQVFGQVQPQYEERLAALQRAGAR